MSLAQRDLANFWSALNLNRPDTARDALLEFFPDLVTTYGDTAAVLGADWYDMLRDAPPSAASFDAVLAQPSPVAQAQGSVRYAAGDLFTGNIEKSFAILTGAAQRLVLQPGRSTVVESTSRDPHGVAYARVPSGAETCRFCTMLASRGFVYASAKSAGSMNDWHDICDCVILPGKSNDDYPGDLDELYQLYQDGSGIGRDLPDQ